MVKCGECTFNTYEDGEFVCGNENSDNYGLPTGYNDSCMEGEEK